MCLRAQRALLRPCYAMPGILLRYAATCLPHVLYRPTLSCYQAHRGGTGPATDAYGPRNQ
eukprot:3702519-Rhodomonas_salina.2